MLDRGNGVIMCHRCKRKQIRGSIQRSGCVLACRHGGQCTYATRGDTIQNDHEARSVNVLKTYMAQQKG